jgi:hypothetical protein
MMHTAKSQPTGTKVKPFAMLLLGATLGLIAAFTARAAATVTPGADRARLIVLADMGNEPDEVQQMLHLLMYSSELDLEGLIAVSGKHLRPEDSRPYRRVLHPELFHELIDGYKQVYPNLQLHAAGWPAPEHLRSIVASGQPGYGVADVGEGKSSPGSQLIITAATRPDPRPLHIVVNAGANTLAQALWDYRATHSPEELKAFVTKLRVFENQAQDNAGAWICHEFPDIHWIRSIRQTRCYGGPDNQNVGPHVWAPYEYTTAGQDAWAADHVRTNHGALGALYPQRKIFDEKLHFIEGGGTIPWLRLVVRGLSDPSEPSSGGWSGRYSRDKKLDVPSPYKDVAREEEDSRPFRTYAEVVDGFDSWTDPVSGKVYQDVCTAIWPWRTAMWNDFQARMDWCVEPYAKANHHPRAALNADTTDTILKLSAQPGDVLKFTAAGSTDPDGDGLRYSWWFYPEAGRQPYGRGLPIENPTEREITVTVPADAAGRELHLILEVWDQSLIVPLVDYRRVVITVAP